ncbi:22158_t:CDS:1, partial [Gigaspora rosea]
KWMLVTPIVSYVHFVARKSSKTIVDSKYTTKKYIANEKLQISLQMNYFYAHFAQTNHSKKKSGWSHHETLKHFDYNIPSKNLLTLPDTHINKTKNILVYLIQSRLKLHSKHSGPQTISALLTESEFISIFKNNIKRYSICHQRYVCRFSGYDAYNTLSSIFNQENWGRRVFEQKQRSEVVLVKSTQLLSLKVKLNNSFQVNPEKPEMIIIWKNRLIKDEEGNISEAGWITLKFLAGQFY